jgi:UDP-N-acetylglucosamine 3-dehydrogenase
MEKLRIGMVGLGTIAKKAHLPALSTLHDAEIVAAAEVNQESGKKVAEKWDIPAIYQDYNEMFEESGIDAAFICLPCSLHAGAIKSALMHDIHVFCEKPMGVCSSDACEAVKTANRKDLVLAVGYNRRLENRYEEVAHLTQSQSLGRIMHAYGILVHPGPYAGWIPGSDWFFADTYGVLADTGSHLMDLLRFILADPIIRVYADGISTMHGVDVIDTVAGVFRTEQHCMGTFMFGWKVATTYDAVQVHGTGRSALTSPMEIEIRDASYGSVERIQDHFSLAGKIVRDQLARMNGGNPLGDSYAREDRAFVNAVLHHSAPAASGEDGLRSLEVLEAIQKSIETKSEVSVEFHPV